MHGSYFHETLHLGSFMKIKPLQKGEITLSFTGVGKSCPGCKLLSWQRYLNAICEK